MIGFDDDIEIMMSDFSIPAVYQKKSGDEGSFNMMLSAQTADSSVGHFDTRMRTCYGRFKSIIGIIVGDKITANNIVYDVVSVENDLVGLSTATLRQKP